MEPSTTSLRVLTYNIHGWRTGDGHPNLAGIGQVLEDSKADIIGLNEVFHPRMVDGTDRPALEALAERLAMDHAFGPCVRFPLAGTETVSGYGNALLSRWPINREQFHPLTVVQGREPRGLLEVEIGLPKGELTVFVTHLDHMIEEVRLTQLASLLEVTQRAPGQPHLVLGDFNAISLWDYEEHPATLADLANSDKARRVSGGEGGPRTVAAMEMAGYTDVYRQFGERGQQTYIPATDPKIRIDYIFADPELATAITSCQIWQEPPNQEASDHRPVYMDMTIG